MFNPGIAPVRVWMADELEDFDSPAPEGAIGCSFDDQLGTGVLRSAVVLDSDGVFKPTYPEYHSRRPEVGR